MKYLLDTCVISEPIKKQANRGVLAWLNRHDENQLCLSVITIGELNKGINKLEDSSAKKTKLKKWLMQDLRERFEDRMIEINTKVAAKWGEILGETEKKGYTLPVIDALIASTAMVYDLVVVTRNSKDFEHFQVPIENPWIQ